ncbi:MAG: DNA-binding response regulator [Betaproteobacteria bacterium]|nr:DNA-binding response regulator [Betaproteobacteria bacterium]
MAIRVFITDDHAVMRDGLKALLRSVPDFEVVGEACDGRDAVREVLKLEPDVVLMDISMPGLNGIEAVRVLRSRECTARLVMLSMHSTSEHVFRALEAGADGYVLKESAGTEVVAAVRCVHSGRRYMSPALAAAHLDTAGAAMSGSPLERLSTRERQVLQLVVEGRSSSEIAACVHLSPKTVETYRSRMMKKLGVQDVTGLVKFALQHGLTTLD